MRVWQKKLLLQPCPLVFNHYLHALSNEVHKVRQTLARAQLLGHQLDPELQAGILCASLTVRSYFTFTLNNATLKTSFDYMFVTVWFDFKMTLDLIEST